MPGLLDVITQAMEMPTTLATNKLQYQQAQAQLKQFPQYAQTLQAINSYLSGGAPTQPAGLLPSSQPQSQTTQSPTGPVTATALPSSDQAIPVQSGQPPTQSPAGGLLGMLSGAQGMVNAAQPHGGLLGGPQDQQPSGGLLSSQQQAQQAQQAQQQLQQQLQQQAQQGQQQLLLTQQKIAAANQRAAAGQQQAAGGQQQPTQPGGPDNWKLYQAGVQLQSLPFAPAQAYGKALTQYAGARIANDPANATRMAAAKSQLAQDQYGIQQAQANGDPIAAKAAMMRYLTDSKMVNIANNNNAVSTFGITPQQLQDSGLGLSAFNPGQGNQTVNGVQSAIPGAPATRQALAGAQSLGEAQGRTIELADPKTGQTYTVPLSAVVGGIGPNGQRQPGPAAGATTALSPGQHAQLETTGEESGKYLQSLQEQADAATQSSYTLDQMSAAAKNVTLGPAAGARQWMQNAGVSLAQMFGVTPPAKELTNYQELSKYSNQIAFAASRQLGSREAEQIVTLQMESNPNKSLMPQAFAGLVQSMKALNNYSIAKNQAIQGVASDQASALKAASAWTSKIDPRVWDLSLGSDLANRFAGQIGAPKIATALPFMANEDATSVMRNLPTAMQAQVLRALPVSVKQQILQGLQSPQAAGATGTY